jgi:hypothetical protein
MAAELVFKDEAAAEYDRAFAHVTAHFMPFLLRAAHVAADMHVLDIATGTGLSAEAALAAVGPTGHVMAADVSPARPAPWCAPIVPARAAGRDAWESAVRQRTKKVTSGSANRQRTQAILVRVHPVDGERLRKEAAAVGISVAGYLASGNRRRFHALASERRNAPLAVGRERLRHGAAPWPETRFPVRNS